MSNDEIEMVKSKTKFCHYTSVKNARNILSNECIFLSKFSGMNDITEAGLHSEDMNRVFVLSLCHSEALNIPVFYLYGGINGKGCRIQFTDTKIREILQKSQVFGVNKQYRLLKNSIDPSEYKIISDWVYYISTDGYCEHRNDTPKRFESKEKALLELKKTDRNYFVKSPIWKYENEFRIIVAFNKDIPYDRVALRFNIKNNDPGISVKFGPETTQEEFDKLKAEFKDYGIDKSSKSLDNAIKMDLIDRNKELLKARESKQ